MVFFPLYIPIVRGVTETKQGCNDGYEINFTKTSNGHESSRKDILGKIMFNEKKAVFMFLYALTVCSIDFHVLVKKKHHSFDVARYPF